MVSGRTPAPAPADQSPSLWRDDYGPVARKLLDSGVRCFAASGYHATTTRDITSAVGLSPGALYVHFSSKEELLFGIVRSAHRSALATLQDAPADEDAVRRLGDLVFRFVVWHAHHHVAARVSQYELAALSQPHYEQILESRRASRSVFRDAVTQAISGNRADEIDSSGVARAILSLGVDLVRWYRLDGPESPEQLGSFYADLALRMVAPRPARRGDAGSAPSRVGPPR